MLSRVGLKLYRIFQTIIQSFQSLAGVQFMQEYYNIYGNFTRSLFSH